MLKYLVRDRIVSSLYIHRHLHGACPHQNDPNNLIELRINIKSNRPSKTPEKPSLFYSRIRPIELLLLSWDLLSTHTMERVYIIIIIIVILFCFFFYYYSICWLTLHRRHRRVDLWVCECRDCWIISVCFIDNNNSCCCENGPLLILLLPIWWFLL